jgi:colanic acid/amylovoran biosynthesis protein
LGLASAETTADLAFALTPASPESVDELWRGIGVVPASNVLGVSVSGLVASHHAKRGPQGGDFYREMAGALDRFARRHKAQIVFFPHVTGPAASKDDRKTGERVRRLMEMPSHAVVDDLAPAEIKGMIGAATWFVGCRMHSNIAALSSGVPVAAIAYSHKTEGIMTGLGLHEYVLDVADLTAESVDTLLNRVVADSAEIRSQLSREMPGHVARAVRNVELALATVGTSPR